MNNVQLEIDQDVASGKYSNLAIVNHSMSEFVVDFAALLPGVSKAKIHSRIILTPEHANRLAQALLENISKYNEIHKPKESDDVFHIKLESKGDA